MTVMTIAGDSRSALTHFALCGLATLADFAQPGSATISWSTAVVPQAQLTLHDGTPEDISERLLECAQRLSADDSWTQLKLPYGAKRDQLAPFSPRIKAIDPVKNPGDWPAHAAARHQMLDQLLHDGDELSLTWISALGEAAYWRFGGKDRRPDDGASRWEMKTRNKGEEFVGHRLGPMCRELSTWSIEAVLSGLTGQTVNDSVGKNSPQSRTSTGLTTPGPTDVALAFAGLIGISCFPLAKRSAGVAATPGAAPNTVIHPRMMALPAAVGPMTRARFVSIVTSESFRIVQDALAAERGFQRLIVDPVDRSAAEEWLHERGIAAIVVFPIRKGGSASAPERQVLDGEVVPLVTQPSW